MSFRPCETDSYAKASSETRSCRTAASWSSCQIASSSWFFERARRNASRISSSFSSFESNEGIPTRDRRGGGDDCMGGELLELDAVGDRRARAAKRLRHPGGPKRSPSVPEISKRQWREIRREIHCIARCHGLEPSPAPSPRRRVEVVRGSDGRPAIDRASSLTEGGHLPNTREAPCRTPSTWLPSQRVAVGRARSPCATSSRSRSRGSR